MFDGDEGPNTGGMGAFAPANVVSDELQTEIRTAILEPLVKELKDRGTPLQGAIYPGVMLTAEGPKVIEFNARLGDPETQVMLPLLNADLAELCHAVATGSLRDFPQPESNNGAAIAVVLASGGYPGPIRSGLPITGLERVPPDVLVFHAGSRKLDDGSRHFRRSCLVCGRVGIGSRFRENARVRGR